MSLWTKFRDTVRGVAAPLISAALPGPIGSVVGGLINPVRSVGQVPAAPTPMAGYSPMPGAGFTNGFQPVAGPLLPLLGGGARALAPLAGRALGLGAGMAIRGARTAAASAMTYCRRHPGWCASIGGLAAVEALIGNGSLPPVKRRRARGITGTELKNFKRVSRTLNRWCKVPAPTQRARRKC